MRTSRHPCLRATTLAAVTIAVVSCVGWGREAMAQGPAPTAPVRDVVPPKPLGPTVVLYPDGAQGDAVVILHLLIDATGIVSEALVMEGDEPFATEAQRAALTWHFAPAQRAGQPTAARIRFEVRFRQPLPPPPEPAPKAPTEPAQLTPVASEPRPAAIVPAPPVEPVDVYVIGEKPPPSVTSLTRAEVRQLPGAFGDPFRAIEALPGVTPMFTGIPYFFVRGSPPGNVGYFLDGIRVPLLYHIALGPSVIHPALVERVDMHPGGYPAEFGRFAGGIVAAETTPPAVSFRGEGNLRLIDAGALLEDTFADRSVSASVAGRYSYTALALSIFSPEVVLSYWDYQARAAYRLDDQNSVGLFTFGAYDYLGEKQDGTTSTVAGTEFHRIDFRYDHDPSPTTHMRTALTVGYDRSRGDEDSGAYVRDRLVSARYELRHRRANATLRAGADVTADFYGVVPPDRDEEPSPGAGGEEGDDRRNFDRLFPTRTDVATGVYASVGVEAERGVTVTPGVRVDLYHSDGATAVGVDPRISARYDVNEQVRLLHAFGLVHQPPAFAIPVPGFQIGGLRGGLQRAFQTSSGVEVDLPADVTASLTLFQNVFLNMTDAIGLARVDGGDFEDKLQQRALGRAAGAEVYVRRRLTHRLGGFLSYTLSRSTRSIGRVRTPSAFDRTHVLNVALAYDLGRRWRAGSRFTYYSGFPGEPNGPALVLGVEPRRAPGFYRADVRLEKRWLIGNEGAWWAFVFEVLNATLQKEVVEYTCGVTECTAERIGPVTVPSIGLEASF